MKVNIVDVNRIIKVNNLQEVTNPVFFEYGNTPTSDGLFSYEIFGRLGSDDRKEIFAYIDLKEKFLHPLAYKALSLIDRKVLKLISGTEYFIFDEKINELRIAKDDENGQTGLRYLYKIFDKYISSLKNTDSIDRKERLSFLKTSDKNALFMDKLLVCPAYYRDINYKDANKGKIDVDRINDKYAKILNLVKSLKTSEEMDFVMNATMSNIQITLNQVTDYFLAFISGHNPDTGKRSGHGLFHENVLGKNIDLSVRSVISCDPIQYNSYKDMKIDVYHTGVPLSQICVEFFDFIMKGLMDFFENNIFNTYMANYVDKNKDINKLVYRQELIKEFSYDKLKTQIYKFIKTPSERFEKIEYFIQGDKNPHYIQFTEIGETTIKRPLTWCDLLYIVAEDVTKDKHVYISRYPVLNYNAIYPSKITVLTTFKTTKVTIFGKEYDNYPIIDFKMTKDQVANNFVDSLMIFNGFTGSITTNADFDGKVHENLKKTS